MNTPDELLQTAFIGPWVRSAQGTVRVQHVYTSLLHWYEAAKFMPHKPEYRDATLFQPTIKEVKRFAKLRQDSWRSDWNLVRPSIVIAGLGFLAIQRPELELRTVGLDTIKTGMSPMGLPERFVDSCLERFDAWRKGPSIGFVGAEAVPEQVLGKAVARLVSSMPTWSLVTTSSQRAPWRLHDWCLSNFIPIAYVGSPASRFNRRLHAELIERSEQVVVFEERKARRHDAVITYARQCKKKVLLELYAPAADQPREIDGLN